MAHHFQATCAYFTQRTFSIVSVLIFVIVASLFFAYITVFDHFIDEQRSDETGNLLIYLHYPIIFGISMITVSLRFITERSANAAFATSFLYVGIGLLYLGLWLARHYQQEQFRENGVRYWMVAIILTIADIAVLMLPGELETIIVTVACCVLQVRQLYGVMHN